MIGAWVDAPYGVKVAAFSFIAVMMVLAVVGAERMPPPAKPDPFKACLRDWPLAECQARKEAGALE
jgi:hypothetical protein